MWEPIELVKLLKYLTFQHMPNAEAYEAFKAHPDDLVWLQFTGLLDKNGKEIYEGDILAYSIHEEATPMYIEVVIPDFFIDLGDFNITDNEEAKIVGNIYENPELIKS